MTTTNGAHVEVTTDWGPIYSRIVQELTNGALVELSLRGIERVIEPPTYCGMGLHALVDGVPPCGDDPWDL